MLIVICNPNILNPGPNKMNNISVCYANVQGFIPFTQLKDKHPELCKLKVLELNTYLSSEMPAIIVLNETWLKKSILDNEIIFNQTYKIFRRDRPKKIVTDTGVGKVGGGGVLIGIRSDLDVETKVITTIKKKSTTELMAVEVKFKDGTKLCVATCYRTGNMKDQNHNIVDVNLKKISEKYGKFIFVGDINLPGIDWENQHSSSRLETKFINTFHDIGFQQMITKPTHKLGNILDLLLTTCPHVINNLNVDPLPICGSGDHSTITFNISKKYS